MCPPPRVASTTSSEYTVKQFFKNEKLAEVRQHLHHKSSVHTRARPSASVQKIKVATKRCVRTWTLVAISMLMSHEENTSTRLIRRKADVTMKASAHFHLCRLYENLRFQSSAYDASKTSVRERMRPMQAVFFFFVIGAFTLVSCFMRICPLPKKTPSTDATKCAVQHATRSTHARAGALVQVSHGWVPVDTRSTPVPGLPGKLWAAHRPRTTAQPRHDNLRAQQSSRDDEVPQSRQSL